MDAARRGKDLMMSDTRTTDARQAGRALDGLILFPRPTRTEQLRRTLRLAVRVPPEQFSPSKDRK